jgi:ice-binding like protein/exosortase sorting signal-containing protein
MKRKCLRLLSRVFVALLCGASPTSAQTAPSLGSAQSFAVLGGSTVTNTGPSVITGDLGVSPGSAVTGFPPGLVVSGTIHAADAVALAAQNSVTTAYNSLASQACTQDLTGQDLGGKTLTAGVYCFSSSAQLTGGLTLNAQGNANAVFIFKIGSTLTTASNSTVSLINGGSRCNVFWQVGSSATLGTATSFAGNILALTSITLTTGAAVFNGRALARNGAVTLDTNQVTVSTCVAPPPPPPAPPPPPPTPTLSEWAFIMLALLLATAGVVALRRRTSA